VTRRLALLLFLSHLATAATPTVDELFAPHYTVAGRRSFRTSVARSDFRLSGSERALYFQDEDRSGRALKRVHLETGAIRVVRKLSAREQLAPIPGRPDAALVAVPAPPPKGAYRIRLLNAATGREVDLWSNTDGVLAVSPSGRYLATGTDYVCGGANRDCFAQCLTVLDLKSESVALDLPVLIDTQLREVYPDLTGQVPSYVDIRRKALSSLLGFGAEDELLVELDGAGVAYRRDGEAWVASPAPAPVIASAPVKKRLRLRGPTLRIPPIGRAPAIRVTESALFTPGVGAIYLVRGRRCLLLLKERLPSADTPDSLTIEYVVLTPKR